MKNNIVEYILKNKEKHYKIAYSYVKNKDDALDVVQESIVKALKNHMTLNHIDYINSWFCKILINTAIDHLKRQNRYLDIDQDKLENQKPAYDQYTNFDLQKALDNLSYKEKTIIILRFYEEMELKQVSHIMDQELSTVKSTLYRALKKLRIMIED